MMNFDGSGTENHDFSPLLKSLGFPEVVMCFHSAHSPSSHWWTNSSHHMNAPSGFRHLAFISVLSADSPPFYHNGNISLLSGLKCPICSGALVWELFSKRFLLDFLFDQLTLLQAFSCGFRFYVQLDFSQELRTETSNCVLKSSTWSLHQCHKLKMLSVRVITSSPK